MSCLEASISRIGGVNAVLEDTTKRITAFCYTQKTIVAHCSLVCSVHNSLNILTDDGKILFDGEKVLLV